MSAAPTASIPAWNAPPTLRRLRGGEHDGRRVDRIRRVGREERAERADEREPFGLGVGDGGGVVGPTGASPVLRIIVAPVRGEDVAAVREKRLGGGAGGLEGGVGGGAVFARVALKSPMAVDNAPASAARLAAVIWVMFSGVA